MAKNLKLNIKNTQIAKALNLDDVKGKLAQKKAGSEKKTTKAKKSKEPKKTKPVEEVKEEESKEEAPRIKARSKSVFAESEKTQEETPEETETLVAEESEEVIKETVESEKPEDETTPTFESSEPEPTFEESEPQSTLQEPPHEEAEDEPDQQEEAESQSTHEKTPPTETMVEEQSGKKPPQHKSIKLGPTGRHINDILPPKPKKKKEPAKVEGKQTKEVGKAKPETKQEQSQPKAQDEGYKKKPDHKSGKFKEFRDVKPARRQQESRFDARDRHGLRSTDEGGQRWRKKRAKPQKIQEEIITIRPSSLKVRLPISIKDLASEMKLKASQLIEKLFLQGAIYTLNDSLDDETTIQLLGHEFQCEISIDTSEEERIRITDKTIKEEIDESDSSELEPRAPVAAFMGHVDHGKTSLIDAIRESNRVAGEAGAITQHIGAFKCHTAIGDIAILDTPGHEAFSEMRARGADVTDIVVLVVAGDEGLMPQTDEAIQHAKAAGVTIIVAINKCDKPGFDQEKVYRQLADHELLPEPWGGQTITVNCSAVTGEGITELLEMLALQAEVLELKANPSKRARGAVLESEMHKGMGATTTVLVQNGTLHHGDALVFDEFWGRVKTLRDEHGKNIKLAGPSTPVEITGLSGLPSAGQEFIVVSSEKEAREIAGARAEKLQTQQQQRRPVSIESLMTDSAESATKKVLNVILRADVQGSLEALKVALMKIESDKVDLNIIFNGVGEISESDVQLAAASKAVIIGFHTQVESHAEPLIKQYGVKIKLHDIIYHAIGSTKEMMEGTLDRLAKEVDKGSAEVKATFKSSQHGIIAGCLVLDGTISRNNHVRIIRDEEKIWIGPINSLKRHKDDVKDVSKGFECGILLSTNDIQEGDIIQAYEVTYIKQEL
ncbi:MAG: translation initiation factor IF-2 [Chlamydiota bacterium]